MYALKFVSVVFNLYPWHCFKLLQFESDYTFENVNSLHKNINEKIMDYCISSCPFIVKKRLSLCMINHELMQTSNKMIIEKKFSWSITIMFIPVPIV